VPDDTHQAQAISRKMWNGGIRVVIPFWRTDVNGNNLVNATKKNFEDARFAVKTGFPNPIYGVENDTYDKFKRIEEIHEKLERTPRSYASIAYDILWISALT
jgi:hypothetical protein